MEQVAEQKFGDEFSAMTEAEFRKKYEPVVNSEAYRVYIAGDKSFARRAALRRRLQEARSEEALWWSDEKLEVLANYIWARLFSISLGLAP